MRNNTFYFLLLVCLIGFTQCNKDDDPTGGDPNPMEETDTFDTEAVLPVIMVHGFLASGDTYATQALRFSSNGYPDNYIHTFDWNTLQQDDPAGKLDVYIDAVLQDTGEEKVNLIGHSAGGGLGYTYLSEEDRADKVNKYVHVGSNTNSGLPGGSMDFPTLNIYSEDDLIVSGGDITGATNAMINGLDHYQVATSSLSFSEIYNFFHGEDTAILEAVPENDITLGGKVVTLGENERKEDVTVEIYALNEADGSRLSADPDFVVTTDATGIWDGFNADTGTFYEFVISSSDPEFRKIHYYREPFTRSDQFVYLRAFPSAGSTAGLLLSGLPQDDSQAVVAVFTSTQAVITGRDELSIDGLELSTSELASAEQTTIAMFCYDDGDGVSSGTGIDLFSFVPFLNGADLYFPAGSPAGIELNFNDRKLIARNWPSATEGVSVVVFN